ncbi:MAG TPA: MFS transporter [Anaeromyxobacteraceae bacterium]|nr:MFS transporter [Anaeromyxobacteraceae bacterium]
MANRGLRGFPPVVWLLGLASLFNDVSSEALFPLLPLFLVSLPGGSPAVLGLVEGAADAIGSAVKVVAGRLSDRGPRRLLVVGGYALPAVARAAIAAAALPWHVLAARLADRAGKGIRAGPRDALLADAARPGEVGRAFGLQRSMDHLGAALGPLVASGLLAAGASVRSTFWAAAGLGLAAPLLLALRLRDPRPSVSSAAPAAPPASTAARALSPPLRRFLTLAVLFALGNSTDAFLLLKARDVGFSAAAIPLLWFGHHLVKTLAGLPGGALSDRVPRAAVVAAGWGAYACAYLGFALAGERWQVAALFGFYALYHGLAEGAERALVADLAAPGLRGRAFGWYHGAIGAAALPAGLATGWIWQAHGSAAALGTCAALSGAAALLLAISAARSRGRVAGP